MNIVRHNDKKFSAKIRELTAASSLFDAEIEQRLGEILAGRLPRTVVAGGKLEDAEAVPLPIHLDRKALRAQWSTSAADIVAFASYIALTALLYELFKPVNRSLSLVAASFSLVASTVQAVSSLFHLAPLVLLGGAPYLTVFTVEQLQGLALVLLRLRAAAYHNIGLVFFGLYLLLVGILILRSTFLPRILGVLMGLAGLSYLLFLSPPLARSLEPYILVFPGVGQISLTLWLLVIGVNAQRWKEQASPSRL